MSNKLILLILMTYTGFFTSLASFAEDNEAQNKLKIIKKNIVSENQKKRDLIKYLDNVTKDIKITDIKINEKEKKIININDKKSSLRVDLDKIKKKIQQIKRNKDNSNKLLKKIIYEEYSTDINNPIYQILNSKSKDVFIDIEISKYIRKSNKDKLDLFEIHENIKIAKANLYNKKITELSNLNNDLKRQLSLLKTLEKDNFLLSQKIKNKIKNSELAYLNYINIEKDLLKLLGESSNYSKNSQILKIKGTLPWPVNGNITNNFNKYKIKNLHRWNGETISTGSSDIIRSIYPGEVVFSDWIKGYGLMIIIDHGEKLMSLYAHNKVLLKNKGDVVRKGEIISKSGLSGGKTENSLYFEIRKNGIPQNPHDWCNIKNKFSLAQ